MLTNFLFTDTEGRDGQAIIVTTSTLARMKIIVRPGHARHIKFGASIRASADLSGAHLVGQMALKSFKSP